MPVNRRELLAKVDKMIEAEQSARPLGVVTSLVEDIEDLSEPDSVGTLSQIPPLALSGTDASTSL